MQHSKLSELPKVTFTVNGEPVAKARPRFGKNGHVYTPKRTKAYEEKVALFATIARQQARAKSFTGPVGVSVTFYNKSKRHVDLDNQLKAVMDSMNKVLYDDDSQVMEIQVRRVVVTEDPRAEITVTQLNWEG